ncbi:MAG: hypothetical protein Ct9H300mP7_3740 [Verrucomicrobiota bacterium]|nr:MAG: hypothetical protein Ct9H300mP7_3740 [Verrucomicrobiota bacterium]
MGYWTREENHLHLCFRLQPIVFHPATALSSSRLMSMYLSPANSKTIYTPKFQETRTRATANTDTSEPTDLACLAKRLAY